MQVLLQWTQKLAWIFFRESKKLNISKNFGILAFWQFGTVAGESMAFYLTRFCFALGTFFPFFTLYVNLSHYCSLPVWWFLLFAPEAYNLHRSHFWDFTVFAAAESTSNTWIIKVLTTVYGPSCVAKLQCSYGNCMVFPYWYRRSLFSVFCSAMHAHW